MKWGKGEIRAADKRLKNISAEDPLRQLQRRPPGLCFQVGFDHCGLSAEQLRSELAAVGQGNVDVNNPGRSVHTWGARLAGCETGCPGKVSR